MKKLIKKLSKKIIRQIKLPKCPQCGTRKVINSNKQQIFDTYTKYNYICIKCGMNFNEYIEN